MNDPNLENLRILEFVLQNVNLKGGRGWVFFLLLPFEKWMRVHVRPFGLCARSNWGDSSHNCLF